jgi:hypothetical protein
MKKFFWTRKKPKKEAIIVGLWTNFRRLRKVFQKIFILMYAGGKNIYLHSLTFIHLLRESRSVN